MTRNVTRSVTRNVTRDDAPRPPPPAPSRPPGWQPPLRLQRAEAGVSGRLRQGLERAGPALAASGPGAAQSGPLPPHTHALLSPSPFPILTIGLAPARLRQVDSRQRARARPWRPAPQRSPLCRLALPVSPSGASGIFAFRFPSELCRESTCLSRAGQL